MLLRPWRLALAVVSTPHDASFECGGAGAGSHVPVRMASAKAGKQAAHTALRALLSDPSPAPLSAFLEAAVSPVRTLKPRYVTLLQWPCITHLATVTALFRRDVFQGPYLPPDAVVTLTLTRARLRRAAAPRVAATLIAAVKAAVTALKQPKPCRGTLVAHVHAPPSLNGTRGSLCMHACVRARTWAYAAQV